MLCLVAQLCPTLSDIMDCSPSGSPVHADPPGKNTGVGGHAFLQGIFQTQGLNPVSHIAWIWLNTKFFCEMKIHCLTFLACWRMNRLNKASVDALWDFILKFLHTCYDFRLSSQKTGFFFSSLRSHRALAWCWAIDRMEKSDSNWER